MQRRKNHSESTNTDEFVEETSYTSDEDTITSYHSNLSNRTNRTNRSNRSDNSNYSNYSNQSSNYSAGSYSDADSDGILSNDDEGFDNESNKGKKGKSVLETLKQHSSGLSSNLSSKAKSAVRLDFDKKHIFNVLTLLIITFVAFNSAGSGYKLPSDPRSENNKNVYKNPIILPGAKSNLRPVDDSDGGIYKMKKFDQAMLFKHVTKEESGESRFEFGEFSGIAATPEEYHQANLKQAEMEKAFWSWVKETTPTDYYAIKIREKKKKKKIVAPKFTTGGLPIPDWSGFKDVFDPPEPTDTPLFFHIPKAGGTTIKNVVGTCHRLTMATEVGVMNGHDKDTAIGVVRPYANPAEGKEGSPFVNVDTTTSEGLVRAKKLGLAESRLAELVVTPLLYDAEQVFSPENQGRIFTVFRHPMERAVSMFFYIQVADWEATYNPLLAKMTIEEYATSTYVENNWMVRRLANVDKTVKLTDDHLQIAMDLVRRKFLVGLLTEKEKSLDRFEKFFGWKFKVKPDNQELCRSVLIDQGANSNVHIDLPDEGTDAHNALLFHNRWDILLYEFIEDLFKTQEAFVKNIPDGFDGYRLQEATCAKCVPPTFPPAIEVPIF